MHPPRSLDVCSIARTAPYFPSCRTRRISPVKRGSDRSKSEAETATTVATARLCTRVGSRLGGVSLGVLSITVGVLPAGLYPSVPGISGGSGATGVARGVFDGHRNTPAPNVPAYMVLVLDGLT